MTAYTDDQLNAIMDRQDSDDAQRDMTAAEVGHILKKEGHPAFCEEALREAAGEFLAGMGEPVTFDVGEPSILVPASETHMVAVSSDAMPVATTREQPTAVEGLEEIDQTDMAVPWLVLKQGMTKDAEGVEEGHWFVRGDQETATAAASLVILAISKGRSFMLPIDSEKAASKLDALEAEGHTVPDDIKGPVCASDDRKVPRIPRSAEAVQPLAEKCKSCQWGKWRRVRGGANVQDCRENYRLLCFDVELGQPVAIRIKGAGIQPLKGALTTIQMQGRRLSLPLWGFATTLSSTQEQSRDGTPYYKAKFSRPKPLEDADLVEEYGDLRAAVEQRPVDEVEE